MTRLLVCMWEFPRIRGTVFWGPHNKDPSPTIQGTNLGSPIFGNPRVWAFCKGCLDTVQAATCHGPADIVEKPAKLNPKP